MTADRRASHRWWESVLMHDRESRTSRIPVVQRLAAWVQGYLQASQIRHRDAGHRPNHQRTFDNHCRELDWAQNRNQRPSTETAALAILAAVTASGCRWTPRRPA